MHLISFCIIFLVGIVVGNWLKLPALPLSLVAVGLMVISAIWWSRPNIRLPILLAATCLFGATRLAYAQPLTTERSVWTYVGRKAFVTGTVTQQPDRREDRQNGTISAEQIEFDGQVREVEGLVLLKLPPNPELRYGQRVRLEGRLEQPETGEDFDYRSYLARHGVYVLMTKPKLTILSGVGGNWWQRTALSLNDRARRTALQLISEPHASLLVGILLGIQYWMYRMWPNETDLLRIDCTS